MTPRASLDALIVTLGFAFAAYAAPPATLVEGLSSADAVTRQAAWQSAQDYDAEAIAPVAALLEHKEPGIVRAASMALEAITAKATAREDTRRAASEALLDVAETLKSRSARETALRLLIMAGGPEVVEGLVKLLSDDEVSETARHTLQSIDGETSTKALVSALEATQDGRQRAAIVTALGAIGHPSAVDVLLAESKGQGPSAQAALIAVGRMGDARAIDVLWERAKADPNPEVLDAYLRLVERQAPDQASRLYLQLLKASTSPAAVVAALAGLAVTGGPSAAESAIAQLTSERGDVARTAAIALVRMPGRTVSASIQNAAFDAGPELKLRLLEVLKQRDPDAAQPLIDRAIRAGIVISN